MPFTTPCGARVRRVPVIGGRTKTVTVIHIVILAVIIVVIAIVMVIDCYLFIYVFYYIAGQRENVTINIFIERTTRTVPESTFPNVCAPSNSAVLSSRHVEKNMKIEILTKTVQLMVRKDLSSFFVQGQSNSTGGGFFSPKTKSNQTNNVNAGQT